MTTIEQARLLREPNNQFEEKILELHRSLWPESHEAYWKTHPKEDWPHRWDGPGTYYEWDCATIEWAASMVVDALEQAGVI